MEGEMLLAGVTLRNYQLEAVNKLQNGNILCGGVGSGKSRTALAYFYKLHGGVINSKEYVHMTAPSNLYIITTARKRDTFEWDSELAIFYMSQKKQLSQYKDQKVKIDSWNNIKRYEEVENAFFIFDEQRVIGHGSWVKSFLKIVKNNQWILLSATPGDAWVDYIPVFVANGFFKNRSEFLRDHAIFSGFTSFPKIEKYIGTKKLERFRDSILVPMFYHKKTTSESFKVTVDYDQDLYKEVLKNRWDPYKDEPIQNAAVMCYILRKIVNGDERRADVVERLVKKHRKVIIFYNFNYELDILKKRLSDVKGLSVAEWNGHDHQPIPTTDFWAYLVQYTAGAEGWNCITSDTVIFYSQNYSYKVMTQSAGRIDRLNTPFEVLNYYHISSISPIDLAITRALRGKKTFSESAFIGKIFDKGET